MDQETLSDNYFQRANFRLASGKYEKAIADYDTAIRLKPQEAAAYYNRGLAKGDVGRDEEARADWQRALELATEQGNEKMRKAAQERLNELPAGNSHENTK